CNLQPKDAAKMPESAWKLLFYSLSWSYGAYLLFCTDYPFFHDPPSVFYDWKQGMEVPRDIAVAYLLQGSFYGHSLYATAYMDTWRKDSLVMLLHHVVALTLIASSYAFRAGQLLIPSSRNQGKGSPRNSAPNPTPPGGAAVPQTRWGQQEEPPGLGPCLRVPPCPPQYIVLFVAKVLLGQMQEVNDVREYDVEESRKS
ncbi:CERS1 synthase, partial [Aegithalos caudatus]|nr:CERS1 synthase [Aegithalos caudatus]